MVTTKIYTKPPLCEKEILRYAGCKGASDTSIEALLGECLKEVLPKLSYKVAYLRLPLKIENDICDMDCLKVVSKDLAKNLSGCKEVILFAATIGVEIDRLIARYGAVSPAKAVMLQAIGAERIEALCDIFCQEMGEGVPLHPRFSPGYGDLGLEVQKDIFQTLNCSKQIGLSLNESLLMSPSKSVTAFVGIGQGNGENKKGNKCAVCEKRDCQFRGV